MPNGPTLLLDSPGLLLKERSESRTKNWRSGVVLCRQRQDEQHFYRDTEKKEPRERERWKMWADSGSWWAGWMDRQNPMRKWSIRLLFPASLSSCVRRLQVVSVAQQTTSVDPLLARSSQSVLSQCHLTTCLLNCLRHIAKTMVITVLVDITRFAGKLHSNLVYN